MSNRASAARLDNANGGAPSPEDDSLSAIAYRLRAFADARDWDQFHTPRNLAVSIAIECGELLEHFQWVSDADVAAHVAECEDEVAEELADVAIYVVQLADALGISLPAAVAAKIERNEQRYPVALARGTAAKHTRLHSRHRP